MTRKNTKSIVALLVAVLMLFSSFCVYGAEGYSASTESNSQMIPLPSGNATGVLNISVKGNTVSNILGSDGDCESLSKWSYFQGVNSLDSSNKVFGSNGIKVTQNNGVLYAAAFKNPLTLLSPSKYYCVSAYLKNGNTANGIKLRLFTNGTGAKLIESQSVTDTSKFNRVFIKYSPSDWGSGYSCMSLELCIIAQGGQYAYADGVMVNEITAEQYNASNYIPPDFVNDLKSVNGQMLRSVGKNLAPIATSINNSNIISNGEGSYTIKTTGSAYDITVPDRIKVVPGETYTLSAKKSNTGVGARISMEEYDKYGNRIGNLDFMTISDFAVGYTTKTIDTNVDHLKLRFISDDSNGSIAANQETAIYDIQLEKGAAATAFEPYTATEAFVNTELRSLQNGVRDEINLNNGQYIKRIEQKTLQDSDFFAIFINTTNVDLVFTNVFTDNKKWINGSDNNPLTVYGKALISTTNYDNVNNIGKCMVDDTQRLYFVVPKGTSYASAKQMYIGQKLIYQLAQPKVYKLSPQSLVGFKNGTLLTDKAVKAVSTYNTKLTIQNSNIPIQSLERVSRIEGNIITPIDLSNTSIASDGLSFTIAGAQKGEMYEYVYKYKEELGTVPSICYSAPLDTTGQINGNTDGLKAYHELVNTLMSRIDKLESMINVQAKVNAAPVQVNCTADQTFNVAFTANNAQDISRCTFTVFYDPSKVQVTDLCTATFAKELTAGYITGSNIVILKHDTSNGIITFTIDANSPAGYIWSGAVNILEFKALSDGQTTISYTVE